MTPKTTHLLLLDLNDAHYVGFKKVCFIKRLPTMYVGSYGIMFNAYFLKYVFHHGLDHILLKKASEIICHCLGLNRQHPVARVPLHRSALG